MNTHNIRFYGELTKIIVQLSSNTLLTCSSGQQVRFLTNKQEFNATHWMVLIYHSLIFGLGLGTQKQNK